MFFDIWKKRFKNLGKILSKRTEVIPLFLLVSTGVCFASGMFIHKMITNTEHHFDKKKRMCIFK